MGLVKIKLDTWQRLGKRKTRYKRSLVPREGFIELCPHTKKVILKEGEKKWKPWDTSVSRKTDIEYINRRKELYSGLCFENKEQAFDFIEKHRTELNEIAKNNPLFDHWSVINVIKRFKPTHTIIYGKDIKE